LENMFTEDETYSNTINNRHIAIYTNEISMRKKLLIKKYKRAGTLLTKKSPLWIR